MMTNIITSAAPVVIPILGPQQQHRPEGDDDEHSGIPEWAMLEVNGELLPPSQVQVDDKENPLNHSLIPPDQLELGSLRFISPTEVVLIIGSHELVGKVETLKQPFCVLEKQDLTDEKSSSCCYRIQGVVNRKVLFNRYPKSIL